MTGTGALLTGASFTAVAVGLAAIARRDAVRMTIAPASLLALVGGGLVWRFAVLGELPAEALFASALGAIVGFGVGALPILAAEALGLRWPFYPGDALLFAAMGGLLGPLGLAWALLAGCFCALAHRVCVQRRRGRPLSKGYLPLGPGMAVGTGAVFLAATGGLADFGLG